MERTRAVFRCKDPVLFRKQLLEWLSPFTCYALLDSCGNEVYGQPDFDLLCGAGMASAISLEAGQAFDAFGQMTSGHDWLFGHFSYDLKNEVESLSSDHPDSIGFPDLFFFRPQIVVCVIGTSVEIASLTIEPEQVFDAISRAVVPHRPATSPVTMLPVMDKGVYLERVAAIRQHIIQGDVYELNFCQEWIGTGTDLDPVRVFEDLCESDRAPMSVLHRNGGRYLISASPERFLKKKRQTLYSMPIKGTLSRDVNLSDTRLAESLRKSIKDQAEHVMITDLVRNDLTPYAETGSIQVSELFGIYSFARVLQMISTVKATLKDGAPISSVIKQAFPMGSMTGAPKVKAMELIECYEVSRRGLYSGAFGYVNPVGDFDFNVVIRSILYNHIDRVVSVQAGGAIVYDSDPQLEYEECLLKASSLMQVLNAGINPQ